MGYRNKLFSSTENAGVLWKSVRIITYFCTLFKWICYTCTAANCSDHSACPEISRYWHFYRQGFLGHRSGFYFLEIILQFSILLNFVKLHQRPTASQVTRNYYCSCYSLVARVNSIFGFMNVRVESAL